jgi:hypothetical protein
VSFNSSILCMATAGESVRRLIGRGTRRAARFGRKRRRKGEEVKKKRRDDCIKLNLFEDERNITQIARREGRKVLVLVVTINGEVKRLVVTINGEVKKMAKVEAAVQAGGRRKK